MGARTSATVAGALGVLIGAVLLVVAPEEPGRTAALGVLTTGVVLTAAVAGRRAGLRARVAWVLLALAAAAATAWSAVLDGWLGWGPALLVAGTVVACGAVVAGRPGSTAGAGGAGTDTDGAAASGGSAVGTVTGGPGVTGAAAPRGDGVARGRGRGTAARSLTAAGAVALVVALTIGAAVALDALAVTSVEAAAGPAPAGAVPDPVAVRWRFPPGDPIRDVRAGGHGVVVLRAGEVAGLDARSGTARWTHRRAGVELDDLAVSPDGRTVVVTGYLGEALRGERDRLATVLDAATGAVRWTAPVADEPAHVTDTLVTLTSGPVDDRRLGAPLVAHSSETGRPLWSAEPDPRCEFRAVPSVAAPVVLQDCPGPLGGPRRVRSVRGLDPASGAPRWTSPPAPVDPDDTGAGDLPVTADGRAVVVARPGAGVVLDTADGSVVARPSPGLRFDLVGSGLVAELDRDGAAVRLLGPSGPVGLPASGRCAPGARPVAFAVVGTRPVLLCANDDGEFDVRTPDRAPLPVGRLAGAGAPVTAASGWVVPARGAVVVAASPLSPRGRGPEIAGLG